ncbi:Zinc ABC transporter, periplasmic-binding protein ZnuA [hydrothermal vent metagenome]|uniref:Zinc ABC transporter, periplasmic-binding protein ZnuA n=1 Tax=hydrothermal vent metagenome TaxID=652676 RepID=A0A1W1B8R0_9ZZZZ
MVIVSILYIKDYNSSRSSEDSAIVTTTIYPLYFITKGIVGDKVVVKRLIKPGNEIHSFAPTPTDLIDVSHSDILITLGKKIEPWVEKMANATYVKLFALEDGLETIASSHLHHTHHHGEHRDSDKSSINPHVWLDFDNDIKMVDMISTELSRLYPKYKSIFTKNAIKLKENFGELKLAYENGLKECKKDTILVGHDAFGYQERRYHFEAESIMGIFAHSRPDAAKIAKLSDMIESRGLRYMFMDPIESSKSAMQLATDMNLTLLPLYTLGNISLQDEKSGKDMFALLKANLVNLKKGLECR